MAITHPFRPSLLSRISNRIRHPFSPMPSDQIPYKVATSVLLVLSIYGNLKYVVGHHASKHVNDPFRVGFTPFTANLHVLFVFWSVLYLGQILFVLQTYYPEATTPAGRLLRRLRAQALQVVGYHFAVFNILAFVWAWLFHKLHWFLAEGVLVANLINVLALYIVHKLYSVQPLSSWLLVHASSVALPVAWLVYAIFWNGAVLFHAEKGLISRLIANVLIWDFLFIPLFFVLIWGDWAVGLGLALLTFGIGLSQLAIKAIALQWIFAFVIAGLVAAILLLVAFGTVATRKTNLLGGNEAAPLLNE